MRNRVKTYQAPKDAVLQKDFIVRVCPEGGEWEPIDCYQVKVDMHDVRTASMAYFDFEGKVEVEISFPRFYQVYQAVVHPLSLHIDVQKETDRVRFVLDRPVNIALEINKDRFHNLHLFAGAIEEKAEEDNTLVLSGSMERPCFLDGEVKRKLEQMPKGRTLWLKPGIYYIEEIIWQLPSHTKIYLEGGVILKGGLVCDHAEDIYISGRGILYQAHLERFGGTHGIRISHSRNITVEGMMFVNPPHYTAALGESCDIRIKNIKTFSCEGWSDGIDMMSCQNVMVEDCFLRTSDDCIAIYGSRWDNRGDTKHVTVKNTSVWADVAHPLMIGTHGDHEHGGDVIEDILFENIDILEHHEFQAEYLGAMAINVGDKNTVQNVTYRNIRIEPFEHGKILDFQVKWNKSYNPAPGKRIRGICLENISVTSGNGEESSVIRGFGPEHPVEDVKITNFYRNGKKAENLQEVNLLIGDFARGIYLDKILLAD